jgi:hypothetical protein
MRGRTRNRRVVRDPPRRFRMTRGSLVEILNRLRVFPLGASREPARYRRRVLEKRHPRAVERPNMQPPA